MVKWLRVTDVAPPEGLLVDTKIMDHKGERNEQKLKLMSRLWWVPDGSMYVYYTPTHWRFVPEESHR